MTQARQTFIADTADVVMRRKSDGHVVFTAEAQLAGITGGEESQVVRGGIGNKALYTVKHSKEVTLSVRNATFDLEYLSISQGAKIETDGTGEITEYKRGVKVSEEGTVTLEHTPIGDVTVIYADGTKEKVEATGQEIELSQGMFGDTVSVEYKRKVTGRKFVLDATRFAESYEVEYKTIEYTTDTNEHIRNIYFVFPNATPTGEYEINLENGEPFTPTLDFNVMTEPNSNELGYIIEEDVV